MLQTAYVEVSDSELKNRYFFNALFDSGSQRTHISSDLRNKLGLKTLRKERIFIKMFGNKTSNELSVDIVPLKVVSSQKIVTIEAICTPVICDDLLNQNIQHISTRYPHLTGLKLAKTSKNLNKQIQILIGSDYCYSFIFGEVLKEEVNEPVAISSLFGWILSGCFDNPTSVNLNSVHVLRIHTKTMSENIFNDKLDSCSKHVFSRLILTSKTTFRLKTAATQQNYYSKSFTTSYLTIIV